MYLKKVRNKYWICWKTKTHRVLTFLFLFMDIQHLNSAYLMLDLEIQTIKNKKKLIFEDYIFKLS
jgi:hypothetical protein